MNYQQAIDAFEANRHLFTFDSIRNIDSWIARDFMLNEKLLADYPETGMADYIESAIEFDQVNPLNFIDLVQSVLDIESRPLVDHIETIKEFAALFAKHGGMNPSTYWKEAEDAHNTLAMLVDAFPHHSIACNIAAMRVRHFNY